MEENKKKSAQDHSLTIAKPCICDINVVYLQPHYFHCARQRNTKKIYRL